MPHGPSQICWCKLAWKHLSWDKYSIKLEGIAMNRSILSVKLFMCSRMAKTKTAHLVQCSHSCTRRRYHIVDKEEQSILRAQMDPLANEKIELADSQVWRYKVLLLVQVCNSCFWWLLYNHLKYTDTGSSQTNQLLSKSQTYCTGKPS